VDQAFERRKLDIVAPATENVYFSVAEAQEADVNRAVAAAREAFRSRTLATHVAA